MITGIRAVLIHLSMNMWEDCQPVNFEADYLKERMYSPILKFDEVCWDTAINTMKENMVNMMVIDLGNGISFKSHPELAVEGAWNIEKLKKELKRLKDCGIEAIPKLNFSTCHDAWMGLYSRMVSTPPYYQCCRDLITETVELFEGPRFFHIGMDEEDFENQKFYNYQVVRNGELWWDDLTFYFDQTRANGTRAWMWSDVLRNCDEKQFRDRVPLDVLQSNWYYGNDFYDLKPDSIQFKAVNVYSKLDRLGYQQIPVASNWANNENFPLTIKYCNSTIDKNNLLGFMTAPWYPTKNKYCNRIVDAIKQFSEL